MDDDAGELERELEKLRHAAFSRNSDDDDRRRLALFESRLAKANSAPLHIADPIDGADNDVGESAFADDEEERDPVDVAPWMISRRTLALGVTAALLAGVLVGVVASIAIRTPQDGIANWSGESSLAVFDRDPLPHDDPSGSDTAIARLLADTAGGPTADGGQLELRWIGAPGGFTTYAARWSTGDSTRVCVVVTSALETASSCVPESDFEVDGIRIMAFGLDLRWGPTGAEVWANSSG